MAFDGIITTAITKELERVLTGGRIDKIYQPESDELIFHIHSHSANFKLYMSCGSSHPRIHLLTESPENPQNPMAFCMLLRKHLQGAKITEISQKDSERILEISFATTNELGFSVSKKLIIEIMGKHSNIILIDITSRKIIDSIKRISIDVNRVRQILPGKEYEYPPDQGKIPFAKVTQSAIENLCNCPIPSLSKSLLSGIQGISPVIADHLTGVAEASSQGPMAFAQVIYDEIVSMKQALEVNEVTPVVYRGEESIPIDFHVFPLTAFEGICEKVEFGSISEAVEFYYSNRDSSNRIKHKLTDLDRSVKTSLDKLYLKKQRLSEDLLKAENSDSHRLYGELLTANMHLVHTGDSSVKVINYYDGSEITIPLDKRISPSKNAQAYFKKYGKSKTAIKEKTVQLEETNQDIAYLESVDAFIQNASSIEEIEALRNELVESGYLRKRKNNDKPGKSKPVPHIYNTSDGFRVAVGRNNKENDILTFKTAERTDFWFHTKDIPGSHVILFTEGRALTETAIFETAAIAAWHSKARTSENVTVDYVQVKHVKKPNGAKPGMVIFTNNRTVYVNPSLPK